ncbi:thyrotroph embryonic factor-like [Lethenteron reissneri]|uniref:thyrotroph embryonic factor-like n=1 Tax=Lethenteron reissneri TaxID=7753 RepID=UPI002AB652B3|nr:thyrotroph embryonic factor-like [Lethenteron reissneri]
MSAHRPFPLHSVLKSLLENPPSARQAEPGEKAKFIDGDEEDPRGHLGVSAFFGPTLWDKTLPYDDSFQLEYMDLDEFLLENGIPPAANSAVATALPAAAAPGLGPAPQPLPSPPLPARAPSVGDLPPGPSGCRAINVDPLSSQPSDAVPGSPDAPPDHETEPAEQQLVRSSLTRQGTFDPRQCKFSDMELKPQPIVKKACKSHVPDELKDERYWARRRKNNTAAKRSRDARRLKENQIVVRASFLEQENAALRRELAEMRRDLGRVRNLTAKYEAQGESHGESHGEARCLSEIAQSGGSSSSASSAAA